MADPANQDPAAGSTTAGTGTKTKDDPNAAKDTVTIPKEEWEKTQKNLKDTNERLDSMEADYLLGGNQDPNAGAADPNAGGGSPDSGADPNAGTSTQPDQQNKIPVKYANDWKAWHKEEPQAATIWQTEQTTKTTHAVEKIREGKNVFLEKLYTKHPQLKDAKVRLKDPLWVAFTAELTKTPELSFRGEGMAIALERAERVVVPGGDGGLDDRAKGAKEEQIRNAQAGAGGQPVGSGSSGGVSSGGVGAGNATPLSADEKKIAGRYNMSDEQYQKYKAEQPILQETERARR